MLGKVLLGEGAHKPVSVRATACRPPISNRHRPVQPLLHASPICQQPGRQRRLFGSL